MNDTAIQICRGAGEALAEVGISALTVADVLRAAGVSRRTFYKYFDSREDVLRGLYELTTLDLIARMEEALGPGTNPFERVQIGVGAYIDFLLAGGPVIWQLQAHAVGSESLLAEERERTLDRIVDFVDAATTELVQISIDRWLYRGLLLAIEGLAIHQLRTGTMDRDRLQRVAVSMMIATLSAGEDLPLQP